MNSAQGETSQPGPMPKITAQTLPGKSSNPYGDCPKCQGCALLMADQYCTSPGSWTCWNPGSRSDCKTHLEDACVPSACPTTEMLEAALNLCHSPCVCDSWKTLSNC